MKIPLEPGDRVVAAFPFRELVMVVTERGAVFKIIISEDPSEEKIWLSER